MDRNAAPTTVKHTGKYLPGKSLIAGPRGKKFN
jgi:hypothetical protein